MLTIENIDILRTKFGVSLKAGNDVWKLTHIGRASDVYQFVFKCIEAHPASGIARETIFNLKRKSVAGMLGRDGERVYHMENIINGKIQLINWDELTAPAKFVEQLLKLLEGC